MTDSLWIWMQVLEGRGQDLWHMEDTGSGLLISKNKEVHQGGTREKWQEKLKINVDMAVYLKKRHNY